jgi:hypothetical protein
MRARLVYLMLSAAAVALLLPVLAHAITRPEVLRFVDVEERFVSPDGVFEEGPPTVGQRSFNTDGLYRWNGKERGTRAGRLETNCTFTKVELARESATLSCIAQAYLPAGQIVLAGFIRFSPSSSGFRVPVVGGTGRYANARGLAVFRDLPSGASAMTVRLIP